MKNKQVLELYSEALGNCNALDWFSGSQSPANLRRKRQAKRRLARVVRVIIKRRIFGVNISEAGEVIANDIQTESR